MAITYVFRRTEKKYRITAEQAAWLKETLSDVLIPDAFGRSTVGNLYLDTPDFRLVRNSLDAIAYKEKLRIRSYGTPKVDETVFFELKKKYKGVVYKRRIALPLTEAYRYLESGIPPVEGQIMKELDYAMGFYGFPQPRVALFYEREAFGWQGEEAVRLTFDTNVRYRTDDLLLQNGSDGRVILPSNTVLMEIKCGGAMPLPLAHLLDEAGLFSTRFSKYGTAYGEILQEVRGEKGGEEVRGTLPRTPQRKLFEKSFL